MATLPNVGDYNWGSTLNTYLQTQVWSTSQIPDLSATYNAVSLPVATKTAAYTLTATDRVVLANSGSAITITLPSPAIGAGRRFVIKNIGAGTCTVQSLAGNIDSTAGSTGVTLAQYAKGDYISDGTNWWTI